MNDSDHHEPPHDALEVQLTALLLGELPPQQEEALTARLADDPDLRRLYERLRRTLGFVQEAARHPAELAETEQNPKLSEARRQTLLAAFRSDKPKPHSQTHSQSQASSRRPWRWLAPVSMAACFVVLLGTLLLQSIKLTDSEEMAGADRAQPKAGLSERSNRPAEPARRETTTAWLFSQSNGAQPSQTGGRHVVILDGAEQAGDPLMKRQLNSESYWMDPRMPERYGFSSQPGKPADSLSLSAAIDASPPPPEGPQPDVKETERNRSRAESSASSGRQLGREAVADAYAGGIAGGGAPAPGPTSEARQRSQAFFDFDSRATAPSLGDSGAPGNAPLPSPEFAAPPQEPSPRPALRYNYSQSLPEPQQRFGTGQEMPAQQEPLFTESELPTLAGEPNSITVGSQVRLQERSAPDLRQPEPSQTAREPQRQSGTDPSAQLGAAVEQLVEKQVVPELLGLNSNLATKTPLHITPQAPPDKSSPQPMPEVQTAANPFSTFSMSVSDVSFQVAGAALDAGTLPARATVRSEEFVSAFDYRDPEPLGDAKMAFNWERSRYPFAHNREAIRFSLKTAAQGREAGQPLNLVILLDNSGSMERADRVSTVRAALELLSAQLLPKDRISVVTFARSPRLWVDGMSGGQREELLGRVLNLTVEGGTNLEAALDTAYEVALRHFLPQGNNRIILLTDGAANLGNVDPDALQEKVEEHRNRGVALDCFGIGWEGYNDQLLEILSRNGDGTYAFLNNPADVETKLADRLLGAFLPSAADVKIQVEFNPDRVISYRQIGFAQRQLTKEQFRDNTVDAGEMGAAEAGNALYILQVDSAGRGPIGALRARYRIPGTDQYQETEWSLPYQGHPPQLESASASMRLAVVAAAFAEWLAGSPYAAEVTPDALLRHLQGVPETFSPDPRPKQLESMIRTAQSLAGESR